MIWLAACLFLLMIVGPLAIGLIALAYRSCYLDAKRTANVNAGHWAASEERAALVEAHNERLSEIALSANETTRQTIDHAKEALRLVKRDPHWLGDEESAHSVALPSDDSILDARELDG